jgi:hypothetical protein
MERHGGRGVGEGETARSPPRRSAHRGPAAALFQPIGGRRDHAQVPRGARTVPARDAVSGLYTCDASNTYFTSILGNLGTTGGVLQRTRRWRREPEEAKDERTPAIRGSRESSPARFSRLYRSDADGRFGDRFETNGTLVNSSYGRDAETLEPTGSR